MAISKNKDRSMHMILKIKNLLSNPSSSTRKLASVTGSLISIFSAIPFAKLRYRNLENEESVFKKYTLKF